MIDAPKPARSNPLVSIIVPTRNRPRLVADALRSVMAQTFEDWECLVVDDAGDEPVRLFADPRVRVLRRIRPGGPAAARNTALEVATGSYVCFLDDDDQYTPDRLVIALRSTHHGAIGVCQQGRFRGDEVMKATADERRPLHGDVRGLVHEQKVPHLGTVCMRRDQVPTFDERFRASEDVEWWVRAAAVGFVSTVPEIGYLVRSHDGPRLTSQVVTRLEARSLLLEVHRSYFKEFPRAGAYHWMKLGTLAMAAGDRRRAWVAMARALVLRPSPRRLAHVARALTSPIRAAHH